MFSIVLPSLMFFFLSNLLIFMMQCYAYHMETRTSTDAEGRTTTHTYVGNKYTQALGF